VYYVYMLLMDVMRCLAYKFLCFVPTRMKMICHMKKKYFGIPFLLNIGCGTLNTRRGVLNTLLMLSSKEP
jgi:hypothetical protein